MYVDVSGFQNHKSQCPVYISCHSQVYGTNCLTCVLTGVVNKYGTLLYKRFTTFQEII